MFYRNVINFLTPLNWKSASETNHNIYRILINTKWLKGTVSESNPPCTDLFIKKLLISANTTTHRPGHYQPVFGNHASHCNGFSSNAHN